MFSKPLSPIGPTQPSRGECDQENSLLNLPRWTPCLFFFYYYLFFSFSFWFVSFHYYPMLSHFLLSLSGKQTVFLISSVDFFIYIFVISVCCFCFFFYCPNPPPTLLSLFCYSCSLCVVELSPGCYGIPVGMCVTHGMLEGSLTLLTRLLLLTKSGARYWESEALRRAFSQRRLFTFLLHLSLS